MLPNDVVVARTNESLMATEQHDPASSGANHHVETTPAIITWIVFYLVFWAVCHGDIRWWELIMWDATMLETHLSPERLVPSCVSMNTGRMPWCARVSVSLALTQSIDNNIKSVEEERITYQKNASKRRKKYPHARSSSEQVVVVVPSFSVVLTQSPSLSYTPTSAVIQSKQYPNDSSTIPIATRKTPPFIFTAVKPVVKLAAANGIRLQTRHA